MIRDNYSYWITARSTNVESIVKFNQSLVDDNIVPDIVVPSEPQNKLVKIDHATGYFSVSYEVDPNVGTVEYSESELSSILDAITKAVKNKPDLFVTFDAIDEDDKSEQTRTVWSNGEKTMETNARTIGITNIYDEMTAKKFIEKVSTCGAPDPVSVNIIVHALIELYNSGATIPED